MAAVLGLDLAAFLCGWCVGDGSSTPLAGAWHFPDYGADLGRLAVAYEDCLRRIIAEHAVEAVAYEAPILTRYDVPLTLRKIYGLGVVTELVCHRLGIECAEVDLRRVKTALTGDSQAKKPEMVRIVSRMGILVPAKKVDGQEDAADAAGVWLLAMRQHNRDASVRWDATVIRARGGLL